MPHLIVPPIALTAFSNGGGQESVGLFHMFRRNDFNFKERWARGDTTHAMIDTGGEHPHTYETVEDIQVSANKSGIEFWFIQPSMGFHTPAWLSLDQHYDRDQTIGSVTFSRRSCTDNLKIRPFYRFLEWYLSHYYKRPYVGNKQTIVQFAEEYGKIKVVIGFAKGEEKRVSKGDKDPVWMQRSIEKIYPLIELGFTRKMTQEYLHSIGEKVPFPSNCMKCHYTSDPELMWLIRFYPYVMERWIQQEAAKLERFAHLGSKNLGVYGKTLLPQKMLEVIRDYGHLTDEELTQRKMTHGHCVMNSY